MTKLEDQMAVARPINELRDQHLERLLENMPGTLRAVHWPVARAHVDGFIDGVELCTGELSPEKLKLILDAALEGHRSTLSHITTAHELGMGVKR